VGIHTTDNSLQTSPMELEHQELKINTKVFLDLSMAQMNMEEISQEMSRTAEFKINGQLSSLTATNLSECLRTEDPRARVK
jgi:hypothetical protein